MALSRSLNLKMLNFGIVPENYKCLFHSGHAIKMATKPK